MFLEDTHFTFQNFTCHFSQLMADANTIHFPFFASLRNADIAETSLV